MNINTIDAILILSNPIIVIAQCIIYSYVTKHHTKQVENAYNFSMNTLKEYMEYRVTIAEDKKKNG